jgi:rRNA maturation endonuclease Nob1
MNKLLIILAGAGVLTLGGCASMDDMASDSSSPAATQAAAAITPEAQAALTQAEADAAAAAKNKVQWTSTEAALKAAPAAAKTGDSEAVLKNAKFASAEAKLSLGQMQYPSTDVFK